MKIIDWECKGNLVRFYLGQGEDYWGDDWDDVPYEHNAGRVYGEFIQGHRDICFPFDSAVYEPDYEYCNSPYSKEDMKNRKCPCVVVIGESKLGFNDGYNAALASDQSAKYYFGDEMAQPQPGTHRRESEMDVDDDDRIYPCYECGVLRSKNEGGTTFTVCDECWDKKYPPKKEAGPISYHECRQ